MGVDNAGRLYLATANSVQIFEDGKLRELLQDNAPIRTVDAFYRDRDGLMWMGMIGGGMRMVADGKISSFFMRDGLFDNEIYGIAADAQDRLWMACSKGIFSVPRADLLRFAKGDLKRIVSSPYSPTDALRVIECKPGVQPAVSLMNNGDLWFSTIRGLIVLDPNHLLLNVPPPPVVIEDVIVNGEHEVPARVSKLAPGRKNLEFQYTGLSFLAPGRITFRYILDGYDKNWIDAGTRRAAYYTNLPPGSFRFRVTACNIDGVCNDTGSSVSFVLASHLYQRAWFWILVAALVGMSVWLAYQLRIRRLREQFSLILSERNRIARELHDTLIQGLSGITMEMQALAARLRSPAERSTLEEIIQDAGTCLRETRRSVAGLRSGTANYRECGAPGHRSQEYPAKAETGKKFQGVSGGRRVQSGAHRAGSRLQFREAFRSADGGGGPRLYRPGAASFGERRRLRIRRERKNRTLRFDRHEGAGHAHRCGIRTRQHARKRHSGIGSASLGTEWTFIKHNEYGKSNGSSHQSLMRRRSPAGAQRHRLDSRQ
jgi:hypothetical protein